MTSIIIEYAVMFSNADHSLVLSKRIKVNEGWA